MNHRRCHGKFLSIESNNSNSCLEDITLETKTYSKKWTLCALVDLGAYKNHQAVKIFESLYQKLNFTCDDLSLRAFSQTVNSYQAILLMLCDGVFKSMGFLANVA